MAELIKRIYSSFRGVDFRGEEINLVRSPDALNVWKDYKETESIRTRPGLALLCTAEAPVWGLFFFRGYLLIHSGKVLYKYENGTYTALFGDCAERKSQGFVYEDIFYFKDGENYLQYNGTAVTDVVGYVPTTSIARKPDGGGTILEDVNMISDYRINTFLGDGEARLYRLDAFDIDSDYTPEITVNGEPVSDFVVSYIDGTVIFTEAPPAPYTDGQDNVSIKFKKSTPEIRAKILGCRLLQVFDNRIFFSGNPDHPSFLWHSSLDDPTYISDLDKYREGMDMAAVRGMVAGNNALWVFREPSDANTTVFYHAPALDDDYGKVYPSTHSSISTGCVGTAINFNDDIIFFSERGMEATSADIMTEQFLSHRSSLVDRKLTAEPGYRDLMLAEWEGYLLVIVGKKVYLADSRAMAQVEDHSEYEWYYWELDREPRCTCVHNGTLYIGTDDGVYTLNDRECAIQSYWTTPKDKFEYPNKLKTTNKRGCVGEAEGDITLLAKLEDTDFEEIGKYEDITDYFVCRIKRKKFKDLQLKFTSETRFSLETLTLECFIGGYIKR